MSRATFKAKKEHFACKQQHLRSNNALSRVKKCCRQFRRATVKRSQGDVDKVKGTAQQILRTVLRSIMLLWVNRARCYNHAYDLRSDLQQKLTLVVANARWITLRIVFQYQTACPAWSKGSRSQDDQCCLHHITVH